MSWGRAESTSQGSSLDVRLGHPVDVISGRLQDVRSGRPWDSQIRPLREVLGMLEGDVFRTSWGPIFACWEASVSELIIIKSYTEVGRGRRSKLFLPTHIDYQRCTLVKGLF